MVRRNATSLPLHGLMPRFTERSSISPYTKDPSFTGSRRDTASRRSRWRWEVKACRRSLMSRADPGSTTRSVPTRGTGLWSLEVPKQSGFPVTTSSDCAKSRPSSIPTQKENAGTEPAFPAAGPTEAARVTSSALRAGTGLDQEVRRGAFRTRSPGSSRPACSTGRPCLPVPFRSAGRRAWRARGPARRSSPG